ncbi:helix-turn-helix transcriptional regulator, partial [Acinetobacter baumannii]
LDGPVTVGALAGILDLSEGVLFRAFKAALGLTPHDYLMDRRLARARLLIRCGDGDLSTIAAVCGFASHAHMTSQFRRRLGTTPSVLRHT